MNTPVFDKLIKARIALIFDQPFFGQLALRLHLVEMPPQLRAQFVASGLTPTLAVDGKKIFYAPEFILGISDNLVKSAIAHEIGHCMFDTMGRRSNREPQRWNAASDYVINQVLKDSSFEIGPSWLLDAQYAGLSSDEVYNRLPTDPNGQKSKSFDLCLDGNTDEDSEIVSMDWKIAVTQAAQTAKAHGKLPAHLERFIGELTAPKIDWRAQLRQFVNQLSKNDYSWLRPNRRFLSAGFYMPSLYSESMGEIAIAIDTSGSITQAMLDAFASEIKGIADGAMPEKIHVIYCDAEVNHVDTFGQYDELHFKMHGGGGTDFCPPFRYLEENSINPACFVYLTDGYGPFPEPQSFPVMWCMTTGVEAPFGENIRLEI